MNTSQLLARIPPVEYFIIKIHKDNVSMVYRGDRDYSYIEKTLDDCLQALIKDLNII